MKNKTRSDMLANEKIGKLLTKLSLPAIAGMLVHALYHTVDTIFIGQWVGTMGIGAISVTLPIVFLIMAMTQTIGIGGASMISRRMGAKNLEDTGLIFGNMILLAILLGVMIQLVGIFALTPLLRIFGATETLLPLSRQYLQIMLISGPLITFSMVANDAVRAEGNAKVAMMIMVAGTILNIILDPIFIYVLKMGVRGAAIATMISMCFSCVVQLGYFLSGRSEILFGLRLIRFRVDIIKEMLAVGSSAFVHMGAMSLMVMILNHTLSHYGGDMGIATFGVIFRLLSFIFMPIMGLTMGLQPIVGFNYGSSQFLRVRQSIKLTIIAAIGIATTGFLIVFIFPETVMRVFTKDSGLVSSGTNALRLSVFFLPLAGCQVVGAAIFQALGKAIPALLLSLSRQVLVLIPLITILPRFYGLNGVWLSFPVADFTTFFITMVFVLAEIKKMPKTSQVAFPDPILVTSTQKIESSSTCKGNG